MLARCYTKSSIGYAYAGRKGIRVCPDWRQDFESFYRWAITNGWSADLELDRKDSEGDYEPSNCRFVTSAINQDNRRRDPVRSSPDGPKPVLVKLDPELWDRFKKRAHERGQTANEALNDTVRASLGESLPQDIQSGLATVAQSILHNTMTATVAYMTAANQGDKPDFEDLYRQASALVTNIRTKGRKK